MQQAVTIRARSTVFTSVRAFHELTKPGITLFVGITALAGYVLGAQGAISFGPLVALLAATMSMSGGAAALNQVAERDLDRLMRRTAGRPLVVGSLSMGSATVFAWLLTAIGVCVALLALPPLALAMLAICHISYVYGYTPLKLRNEACTLVGAIPGAVPVLAGAAVAGVSFTTPVLALTALLFVWQIPHFMAIGWLTRDDYARAGFVMMPVRDTLGKRTARTSLLYAIATHGFAILLTRDAGMHPLVMAVVHTAGTAYIVAAFPFMRRPDKRTARRLFFASLTVLPAILIAVMLNFVLAA